MNKSQENSFKRKFLLSFLMLAFLFSLPQTTKAMGAVFDATASFQREMQLLQEIKGQTSDKVAETKKTFRDKALEIWNKTIKKLEKVGSQTYQSTLRSALNIFAYDTASYIFSGGEGQKAVFTTEYLKDFAVKAGDAAFGKFVDGLNKEWQVDLCRPTSPDAFMKIGLGLTNLGNQEFYKPRCGWQEMKSSYSNWAEDIASKDWESYSSLLADSFSPTGNDVTIALTLFDRASDKQREVQEKVEKQLTVNNGWLDVRNIGGKAETTPGEAERKLVQTQNIQDQSFAQYTGNALTDAANIFLNQSLITAFNTTMKALTKKASGNDPVINFSDPLADSSSISGINQVSETLKKILKPKFNTRADYDILADLSICMDQNNPTPNNCVIDDRFSQAISNRNSVIEAINNGYINGDWVFDRNADYTTAFNQRSLMILRKFRIIPVGWEEALFRAEAKTAETGRYYTLMDMVSCFSPDDEYESFSSGFVQSNFSSYSWCQGLIDPTWSLKSSKNYCKKQGYGGYLESQQFINVSDELDDDFSPVIVSRSDNYCADEQSCIKEKADGTCEYYGYCVEEKRTWNFGEDSCDPIYNTCETFTSSSNGKKLALLKNTIDYGSCDTNNVGCAQYATTGVYYPENSKFVWNSSPAVYFNNKVETCSSNDEGCQELVRTASGVGHNFLINGNFEDNLSSGEWDNLNRSDVAYNGNYSILLSQNSAPVIKDVSVAPSDYVISGESYTLSFYSYCTATSTVSLGSKTQNIFPSEDFTYQAIAHTFPGNYSSNKVSFNISSGPGECFIDAIKLERGVVGTYYSENRANGKIYEKIIPDYLKSICYVNPYSTTPDYRLKLNAPQECQKYARQCNANEIACRLFTSIYNIRITAKALEKDYCPDQCVGYDIYAQNKTLFENKAITKLIPSSAQACSAAYAGCTEFTNLDELAAGGEAKEYYTSLKHCVKPTQAQVSCQNFYSWGGSGSGYQLESYSLERDVSNWPKLTEGTLSQFTDTNNVLNWEHKINGASVCNRSIFESAISAPEHNSDCRQFYTQDGDVVYLLYSRSITCSESCKTYRMTEKNIDTAKTSSTTCSSSDNSTSWDAVNNVCYYCLGGGRFDATQNACLYQAIPGEGQTCAAASNNCREYNGNAGNNVRNIGTYDFKYDFNDFSGFNISSSTESLNQNGRSMVLGNNAIASATISNIVKKDSSYVIKFLAKNTQARELQVYFENNSSEKAYFNLVGEDSQFQIPANSEWQLYQLSLANLNHVVSSDEKLVIKVNGNSDTYISSLIISEIAEKYYLIKNSWATPEICYYDTLDNYRGVNYNLGCQKYVDNTNTSHNLRQFSSFCSDSSLGCEMMLKGNGNDFIIATYDTNKTCSSANIGCARFGKVVMSNNSIVGQNVYEDVFLKNNDRGDISCGAEDLGCDSWSASSASGVSYFKDPGDNLCHWRKGRSGDNSRFSWYKKDIKKCKGTNNVCSSDSDCSATVKCELDTNDYLCPVENMKTIGNLGDAAIWQPKESAGVKWAGLCPIKDAGCTEYIDPVSSFSPNIIINPNFSDLDGNGKGFDMWTAYGQEGSCSGNVCFSAGTKYTQSGFEILPNKLYLLETKGDQKASIECTPNPIYELTASSTFSDPVNLLMVVPGNSKKLFYSGDNNSSCSVNYITSEPFIVGRPSGGEDFPDDAYIQIREAVVDYKLKQNLDFTSCNGQADLSKGCVVFNQREFNNPYTSSNFNSSNYSAYSTCSGGNCDANTLIKVSPDRDCGRWLSCFSYSIDQNTGEKNCNQMMECTAFNYDGSCLNFAKSETGAMNYTSGRNANASGYSVLGMNYLANMNQIGRDAYFFDDFETNSLGKWYRNYQTPNAGGALDWKLKQIASSTECLVNSPSSPAIAGKKVSYPALGKGFLKVGDGNCSGYFSTIEKIPLTINSKYYLSFMVNTDDLSTGATAKVKFVGYNSNGQINSTIVKTIYKKSGWQDSVLEIDVKNEWTGGVVIQLESSNNNSVYFDDFKITPVLEKGEIKTTASSDAAARSSGMSKSLGNLEVNKFISPTCRLYPTEDSLMCENNNKSFSANGWYGYCLQKDPKNPNVCLMWYPIDSVKGTKGSSGASSAFTGYTSTGGARPYYCAEMSADFDLVYKVEPFYSGLTFKQTNNNSHNSLTHSSDLNINLGNSLSDIIDKNKVTASKRCGDIEENFVETIESPGFIIPKDPYDSYYYWLTGAWNVAATDRFKTYYDSEYYVAKLTDYPYKKIAQKCYNDCDCYDDTSPNQRGCGTDKKSESWRFIRVFCSMGIGIYNEYYDTVNEKYPIVAKGDKKIFDKNLSRITLNASTYCDYKETETEDFSLPTFWRKWDLLGNKNFSANVNTYKPALDLRIMAYDYGDGYNNEVLCDSLNGKYYDCNEKTQIKCPQTPTPRSNACLLEIDKYVPLCSKVVQGEVPWVQRLKTAPYSIANYASSANSLQYPSSVFINSYNLNNAGIPFGAIVTNGDPLNASSTVFAGSAPIEGAKYGLPYSCDDKGQTSYISGKETSIENNKGNCNYMYFDGKKVVLAKNKTELVKAENEGRRYTNIATGSIVVGTGVTSFNFRNILKTIWLKVSAVVSNSINAFDDAYDFSFTGDFDSTSIDTVAAKTSATEFKAVLPKVTNISLNPILSSGLSSTKSKIAPNSSGAYEIEKAGFYALTFNTTVDAEQMPIKRLSVRIKSTVNDSDKWDNASAVIDLYNIDPMPDSSNPHKIVRYLQADDYYVLIKLEDNWGFYQCLGYPSSIFSNSACCKENSVFSYTSCPN